MPKLCRRCSPPRRLSTLARQRPLACHQRCASSCPLPVSVRPHLQSSSSLLALVPCPSVSPRLPSSSRRLSSLAHQHPHRRRPPLPLPSRRHPCRPINLRRPAPPQSLSSSSRLRRRRRHQSRAFWSKYLFTCRGISY